MKNILVILKEVADDYASRYARQTHKLINIKLKINFCFKIFGHVLDVTLSLYNK